MATQAVHNASRAFWNEVDALRGEQQAAQTTEQRVPQSYTEEPIAGVQGKGTISDPYDAGNRDEQPEAPISKEPTAATTEPLSSITPGTGTGAGASSGTGTGTFQDKYRRGSDKATLVTSGIGSTNPTVGHPAPVSGTEHASGLGAKSTHRDEGLSGSRSTADEPQPTMTTSKPSASTPAATAAAGSTTGSTAAGGLSEQRSQPSTSQSQAQHQKTVGGSSTTGASTSQPEVQGTEGASGPSTTGTSASQAQTQGKEGAGESSTTGTSASQGDKEGAGAQNADDVAAMAKKKGVSEETLRGPKVSAPRESYEKQKKFSTAGLKEGESTDQPKSSKPG
ncbi:hypothetical protein ASPSYDRAFT_27570 [Aspergillus sydowii CBS 593.65]|uniref:Uncharacterized protein n=1 Tax=Aspergillus sydowii CBS 593.65 TaxID=1036612 RepID=A0A1L9TR57_9EURO|nr:uncharacterized protein ASPSYDRAFT_27570 [Aspergillus sydowii CBS 593.65]OJJ61914.1 hypothetical protein ASPSYDRAFT_27570 [Aspergillus sydowii CBS 593.65]